MSDARKRIIDAIEAAKKATAHLRDYRTEYIEVRIVCAPGEPDIFHKCACNAAELLALLNVQAAPASAWVKLPNPVWMDGDYRDGARLMYQPDELRAALVAAGIKVTGVDTP